MCWCAGGADAGDCVASWLWEDMGALVIAGPVQNLRTCVSGQTCAVQSLRGESLGVQDEVRRGPRTHYKTAR